MDTEDEEEERGGGGDWYLLPSPLTARFFSQAALILHEDYGRNGDIGGGMLQPPYSTSFRVAVFNVQTSKPRLYLNFFRLGRLFKGLCNGGGNRLLALSLSLATASWNFLVFLTLASAHPLLFNVV